MKTEYMSAGAIQYFGIDQTVNGYVNRKIPAFAVWCGKRLNFQYDGYQSEDGKYLAPSMEEGEQMLTTYLSGLTHLTTAIYSLCMYDDLDGAKIKPSREYSCGFNFKLQDSMMPMSYQGFPSQPNNPIMQELQSMKAEIAKIAAIQALPPDDDDEDDEQTVDEYLSGLVTDPMKALQAANAWKSILGIAPTPIPAALGALGSINNTGNSTPATGAAMDYETKVERLGTALDTIEKVDPNIVDNLEKLAKMAKNEPDKFKKIVGAINYL